jgi:conjugal transfer ATP-binding protein TraC
MSRLTVADYRAQHSDAEPLPDHLPYLACVDEVVLLQDRDGDGPSLGAIWELDPVSVEGAPEDRWKQLTQAAHDLLLRLPEEAALQAILLSDHDIMRELTAYEALTLGDGLVRTVSTDRVRLYQHHGAGLFTHKGVAFRCRRVRIYCTVRLWPRSPSSHGLFWRRPWPTDTWEWFHAVRHQITQVEQMLVDTLQLSGIGLRRLSADHVKALLWRFLNPHTPDTVTPYREHCLLREQLLTARTDVDGTGVSRGQDITVIPLTAMEHPAETQEGMFMRELEFGEARAALVDLFPELCLVWNVHVLNQQLAFTAIKRHKTMAWLNTLDPVRGFTVEHQVIQDDLEAVIGEVFGSGHRLLRTSVHALVAASPSTVESQSTQVASAIGRLGFRMDREDIIGPSVWRQCLPLGYDPEAESIMRRSHRVVSTNTADFLPVHGYFRGMGAPRFLYLSRRGEPVRFDPYEAAPAPHIFVAGVTGTGKSVWVTDAILQARRVGARIFVLDKGNSYGRVCRLLHGQHLVLEPEHPIRINPFLGLLTKAKLGFLTRLVIEMTQGRVERDLLTKEQEGTIERAIGYAYERRRDEQREVILSDVALELEALGAEGRRLALRLQPFLRAGRYGRYFDGPNAFPVDNPLTVIERGPLGRDPELQNILTMVLVNLITTVVSSPTEEGKDKYLFIDELFDLFGSDNAGQFVGNVAQYLGTAGAPGRTADQLLGEAGRTYRKYGTAFIPVTQQPRDLLATRGGQAARDNTQIRLLFRQPPDVAALVGEELLLSAEERTLLHSLETVPGKFAEALLLTPQGSGVIRIVLPASVYWIATTHEKERSYIDELAQRLGSLEQAIAHAAQEYPHGLPRNEDMYV